MSALLDLPEIQALDARRHLVRIPDEIDVPVTPRVQALMDTAEFRRLARISQLGLVSLVYPAANHTRFEHSLGVYRMALLYLKRLSYDSRFTDVIGPQDAEAFMAAALLHDLGHWPFCHPIEDIRLPGMPDHELFANSFLLEGELADTLRDDWGVQPREIVALLSETANDARSKILSSMLSGPIDIDKMDYLYRDSLHAGVPYGQHFDQQRLIGSLCLNEAGDGLALLDKGRTAAEMMVFARYVMFSEVYWHHTVRAATAMLQRAFFQLYQGLELDSLLRSTEQRMIDELLKVAGNGPAADLLQGLFGSTRKLYKRFAQFSHYEQPEFYRQLARRPYAWLVRCSETFARLASQRLGRRVAPQQILFDSPPAQLEVEFRVDVYFPKEDVYRPLEEVSPVVQTLARKQFDDFVKRVRIFIHPELVAPFSELADVTPLLQEAISETP